MAHTHRNRIVSRVAWTLASYAAVLALWLTSCAFAETLPNIDWARRQMADERLTAFGDDMFGDGIDPHTGSITFFRPTFRSQEIRISQSRSRVGASKAC